jgi:hypothetical protein
MVTAGDETTTVGGELRSRGSRSFNPQFGDDENSDASCGQRKGWKSSRLGVLCNRRACLLGIVACLILAVMGISIPLDSVNVQIVSTRFGMSKIGENQLRKHGSSGLMAMTHQRTIFPCSLEDNFSSLFHVKLFGFVKFATMIFVGITASAIVHRTLR